MYISKLSIMAAVAATTTVAAINKITFKSIDDLDRKVYFTANSGLDPISAVDVAAGEEVDVIFPQDWIGNFYSVTRGKENKPGMLGEVAFNGWHGYTYFDVSAIVDPKDLEGVSEMWPAGSAEPTSGCRSFPCNNAYYLPDDVQTKVTSETHLITTLGKSGYQLKKESKKDEESSYYVDDESKNVKRHLVEGKWFNSWF